MNDPHVVSLKYRLVTDQTVVYENPPPIKASEDAFDLELADGTLTVTMKEHHPTIPSAVDRVRDYLRAWELQTALVRAPGFLSFEFLDAKVIDRNPPPTGSARHLPAIGSSTVIFGGSVSLQVRPVKYPDPPVNFRVSGFVEHLWRRYQQFREGRDLLTTMGYACLSMVQNVAGSRSQAASMYSIERNVLDTLGRLTSDIGDETTARKFDQFSTKRPHTPNEKAWIEATVKRLIHRVAEYDYNPTATLSKITMADLPPL